MRRALVILVAAVCAVVFISGVLGCGARQPGGAPGRGKATKVAAPPSAGPQKPAPYIHTVKYPGETLSIIAQWYTGQMSNWEEIAKANPGMNPNQIEIDEKLVIPRELLKTEKPMPLSFVQEFLPKPKPPQKKKADPPAAPPTKKESAPPKADSRTAPESKAPAAKPAPAKSSPAAQPPVIFGPKDF